MGLHSPEATFTGHAGHAATAAQCGAAGGFTSPLQHAGTTRGAFDVTYRARQTTLAAVLVTALPSLAQAQERPVLMTIGIWNLGAQPFPGSDELELVVKPIINFRRPDEREWLSLPGDSGGPSLIKTDRFRLGPSVNIVGRRKASDSDVTRGLGDVKTAYEVGAFAEFWPANFLRTRVEARRGFNGHEGVVVDLSADAVWHPTERLRLTFGPRVSLADDRYMQTYFGVTSAQAFASGLAAFDARGGLQSASVTTSISYRWSDNWSTIGFAEAGKLVGDAADSPIAKRGSDDLLTVGVAATYKFAFDRPGFRW